MCNLTDLKRIGIELIEVSSSNSLAKEREPRTFLIPQITVQHLQHGLGSSNHSRLEHLHTVRSDMEP